MIFCPDGIIPDSGLTGPNNIYIYIICLQFDRGTHRFVERFHMYSLSEEVLYLCYHHFLLVFHNSFSWWSFKSHDSSQYTGLS